jgi:hypothetical protein
MTTQLHNTREEWLNYFIDLARPRFEAANAPLPMNVRVAVGFPSNGSRGKVLSECWDTGASADGHFEIFVAPTLTDPADVCAALTYELARASIGLNKGGQVLRRVLTSLGFAGKMQARRGMKPTPAWGAWSAPLIAALGPMPYARLNATEGTSTARAKQKTYMLKGACVNPACGWTLYTTAKQWGVSDVLNCPVPECIGILVCDAL